MIGARLFIIAAFAATGLAGCDNKPVGGGAPPPPSVTVSHPLQKTITEWDEYTGRFEAVETVEVRARVSGFIDSIHFKDGQIVKQGDLLFIIDQRPYQLAVEQAKADRRARAGQARDRHARRASARRRSCATRPYRARIRHAEIDAARRRGAGRVGRSRARSRPQLNLEWTEVRAPIAGRISDQARRCRQSDHRRPDRRDAADRRSCRSTPSISCSTAARRTSSATCASPRPGARPSSRDAQNPVAVRLADETEFKHQGRMDFVDNVRQSQDRHHPRPRHLRQQGRPADAGLLRPVAAVRRRARRAAHPRQRDRRPTRRARSSSRSPTTARSAPSGSSSARSSMACASSARASRRPTASSSTVCSAPVRDRRSRPRTARSKPPRNSVSARRALRRWGDGARPCDFLISSSTGRSSPASSRSS